MSDSDGSKSFSDDQNEQIRREVNALMKERFGDDPGSQTSMAKLLGVSQSALSLFLRKRNGAGPKLLYGLARLKGVKPQDLVSEELPQSDPEHPPKTSGKGNPFGESALARVEREHPEGLTLKQVLSTLEELDIKIGERLFLEYVRLGILPGSKRHGSSELYPANTLRLLVRAREVMSGGQPDDELFLLEEAVQMAELTEAYAQASSKSTERAIPGWQESEEKVRAEKSDIPEWAFAAAFRMSKALGVRQATPKLVADFATAAIRHTPSEVRERLKHIVKIEADLRKAEQLLVDYVHAGSRVADVVRADSDEKAVEEAMVNFVKLRAAVDRMRRERGGGST